MRSLLFLIVSAIAISNVASFYYGQQAKLGDFKFPAAIFSGGMMICTGAIINDQWILTAAHCLCNPAPVSLRVIIGARKLINADRVSWREVQRTHCYDSFRPLPNQNADEHDIGLLMLKKPLKLDANIQPIPLSIATDSLIGTQCKIVLFREDDRRVLHDETSIHKVDLSLRWSSVQIASRERCSQLVVQSSNLLCVLNNDQNEDAHRKGDSGASIVCNNQLFGILVHTLNRLDVKGAAILMVAPYLKWINSIISPNQCLCA